MKRYGLIIIICLIFLICLVPNTLFAESDTEAYIDSAANPTSSLREAVKNVKDGKTVYLTESFSFSGNLNRIDEKQATINLNGKTLTINSNSALSNITFIGTGNVIISGDGSAFNNLIFNNTPSGSGNPSVTVSGKGNTFTEGTTFNGNITISGQSNTFNSVRFITDTDKNVLITETGTSNTFNGGTTFSGAGTAYIKGDYNFFDNIDFSCNTNISGDSRFDFGTFNYASATISTGEFNGVKFNHIISDISGGEFNKTKDTTCYFYKGESTITGGIFNYVEFNDDLTKVNTRTVGDKEYGAEFYNPTFYNSEKLEIQENPVIKVSMPTYFERSKDDKEKTALVTVNEVTTYSTESLEDIILNAGDNYIKLILQKDVTDNITIGGYQNVILDLNGHSLTAKDSNEPTITLYGNLSIIDSSNKEYFYENENEEESSAIIVSKGYIDYIYRITGTLQICAGTFNKITDKENEIENIFMNEEVADNYLDTRSYWYYFGNLVNKYQVISEGTLDYFLSYKIVDSQGNEVKSVDSDEIQDVSIGEKYSIKVYIKSDNDKAVRLRGFDILMNYKIKDGENGSIKIETPYTDNNRYYSVTNKRNSSGSAGSIEYELIDDDKYTANFYIPKAIDENGHPIQNYEGLQIAQFDFTVSSAEVNTGIEFEFVEQKSTTEPSDKKVSKVAVMRELGGVYIEGGEKPKNSVVEYIPVKYSDTLSLNTRNVYDGVRIADYIYAPEGYILAIISKEHRVAKKEGDKNYTVYYGDEPMWLAEKENAEYYVDLSTNPKLLNANKDGYLNGVYLKLINPEELIKEKLIKESDKNDYNKIVAAVEKKLKIKEGEDAFLQIGEDFDIDCDGQVDYNDASLVYRMIQNGGAIWGYDEANKFNYLSEKSRLLSSASNNRRLYGTIEDVVEIINHYDNINND